MSTTVTVAGLFWILYGQDETFTLLEKVIVFGVMWMGSTIPIVAGLHLARWLLSRRDPAAASAGSAPSPPRLPPDLDRATDHGHAVALVRVYPAGGGAALADDRTALEAWGYDLREQVTARLETTSPVLRGAESVLPGLALGEDLLWAVFVRRFGAPA